MVAPAEDSSLDLNIPRVGELKETGEAANISAWLLGGTAAVGVVGTAIHRVATGRFWWQSSEPERPAQRRRHAERPTARR